MEGRSTIYVYVITGLAIFYLPRNYRPEKENNLSKATLPVSKFKQYYLKKKKKKGSN